MHLEPPEGAERVDKYITPMTRPLLEQVLAATAGQGPKLFAPWANVARDLERACTGIEGIPTRTRRRWDGTAETVPTCTPNDLRRTHANWLRQAGVDTSLIADVLGHTDGRMVERVYGRLRPEQLRDRVLAHVGSA